MFLCPYITNPYSLDISHSLQRLVPLTLVSLFLELLSLAPRVNNFRTVESRDCDVILEIDKEK